MKEDINRDDLIPQMIAEDPVKKIAAVVFDMYETLVTQYRIELYFGKEMSADLGIPIDFFLPRWHASEEDRSIGKASFEEILIKIMKDYRGINETMKLSREDRSRIALVVEKRTACKRRQFEHLHKGIVPMLNNLKKRGVKVGLISNCFSEEAICIRESPIIEYFDAVVLSYEVGLMKPNPAIYRLCAKKLGVMEERCLFIGDGGSHELDGATAVGMMAAQAGWYLDSKVEEIRQKAYPFLETPDEVISFCEEPNRYKGRDS